MNRNTHSAAAQPDFEKSLQELEKLIAQLERGDLPLADSLALFEQGVALTRSCHSALTQAQQRVEILLKDGDGERLRPFDADAEPGKTESTALDSRLVQWRTRTELQLARQLDLADPGTVRLAEAMRYSTLGGGKRLRPILVYATGSALGAASELLDDAAVAVELIHVYSLVHDDLPAMDDDDLRRGRPTCHKAYDEGTAVLVGDALQALAFEIIAGRDTALLSAAARLQQIQVLAQGIGTAGMAGGQAIDLAAVGRQLSVAALESMHRRKTGALIRASVLLGAIAAGTVGGSEYDALAAYGAELGLAFQIQDDVLDVEGETAALGKTAGTDAARGKPTYPSVHGLAGATQLARLHRDAAVAALDGLGPRAADLVSLADLVVERSH